MPTPKWNARVRTSSLVLVVSLAVVLVAPGGVPADHDALGGAKIDSRGVHFDFGPGYHYLHVDFPHARRFFAKNEHFKRAQELERARDEWLQKAERQLKRGRYEKAENTFQKAIRADRRRQRELVLLDRDRVRFERKHRHHGHGPHRRHRASHF
jgi:hypothetical protein